MLPNQITLHIGLQKTATTLIQRSLKRLRRQLAAQGVVYVDRLEMLRLPAAQGWRAYRAEDEPVPEGRPHMPATRTHRADLADDFTSQLRALAVARSEKVARRIGSAPHHLLLSNEAIVGTEAPDFGPVYRPRAAAALRHVLEALEPSATRLVLYVRRQDRLIESQYMQRIHAGEVHNFAEFARAATAECFIRYGDLVERLAAIDSVVEIRVRPFEIIGAGATAFVADLLAPLGLTLDLDVVVDKRANPKYTAPALQAALAINPLLETTKQLRATRKYLREIFPAARYPDPDLFSDAQRQRVLAMYDASNRAFLSRYVPDVAPDSYSSDAATARLAHIIERH